MTAAHRIVLGDEPGVWTALGFRIEGSACRIGDIELVLTGDGGGVRGLELEAVAVPGATLPLSAGPPPRPEAPAEHPNGAHDIDHLVVVTPERESTVAALQAAGGDLRRTGERPELPARMAFLRFGPLIVEVYEHPGSGIAFFWGLTIAVADLDTLAASAGERLGAIKPARQPGRRIATARPAAKSGLALAFMDGAERLKT